MSTIKVNATKKRKVGAITNVRIGIADNGFIVSGTDKEYNEAQVVATSLQAALKQAKTLLGGKEKKK